MRVIVLGAAAAFPTRAVMFRRYRRAVRRRRPFRRAFRRRPFRGRRRRRGTKAGDLVVHARSVEELVAPGKKLFLHNFTYSVGQFPELGNIYANFEAYRFISVRLTVIPLQNVSNNSTSECPCYCTFPWHSATPNVVSMGDALSVDKAKIYRGTSRSSRRYVPNTLEGVLQGDTGSVTAKTSWRPRIEVHQTNSQNVTHYGCCMAVDSLTEESSQPFRYTIIKECTVKFYNQKSIR